MKKIILASASPQRKKIMEQMGLPFSVSPADIDEHHSGLTRPHAIARSIARRKAEAVALNHPEDWIIGCDTIVVLSSGKIAVKPADRDDARDTLKSYQGSHCDVYSGLALTCLREEKTITAHERTRIHFNMFSDESLEEYLDSREWEGRSGSMTIESKGNWISRMEGEYWNVVGLPVDLLKKHLKMLMLI